MPYVITNTPDDPLAGAMRIMGALQVYLHPEVAANAIRHCVQRERQGEWNVIRVEVVAKVEEGKVLAPGHGFNSERSKQSENGGRP